MAGRRAGPAHPKALALLKALVEERGDVMLKSELMDRVWPDAAVEDANLSVTVAALRRVLGERPEGGSWIETVPRRGYRFAAPRDSVSPAPLALAVLPFRAIGEKRDAHLGLGLADSLIARLTGAEGLRVRPTGAVAHLAEAPLAPLAAAEMLQVDAVLDGTYQRIDQRLRLAVQLVPRAAGLEPWAAQFDAEMRDLFAVQDDLAERVAGALAGRLGRWRGAPAWATRPTSLEAWEAWLRGCFFWSRLDADGMSKAVGCFGEAAQLQPAWAPPHAGLAATHVLIGLGGLVPPRLAWSTATGCAEHALELDSGLPEAHLARAWVALYRDWAWADALAALDRAAAIGPRELHHWRALLHALRGELTEARFALELAREADPLSAVALALQAFLHQLGGAHDRALAASRRAVSLRPEHALGHWHVGMALFRLGRDVEAIASLRRAVELSGGGLVMRAEVARGLAARGHDKEARALLAELDALEDSLYVSPFQRARILAALGDERAALGELERSAADRDPWITFLRADHALDSLRGEPRLRKLEALVFAR